jgi:hypothetical protein
MKAVKFHAIVPVSLVLARRLARILVAHLGLVAAFCNTYRISTHIYYECSDSIDRG